MANSKSWKKIFNDYKILDHDFDKSPFLISAKQIKRACQKFKETGEKNPVFCANKTDERIDQIFFKSIIYFCFL